MYVTGPPSPDDGEPYVRPAYRDRANQRFPFALAVCVAFQLGWGLYSGLSMRDALVSSMSAAYGLLITAALLALLAALPPGRARPMETSSSSRTRLQLANVVAVALATLGFGVWSVYTVLIGVLGRSEGRAGAAVAAAGSIALTVWSGTRLVRMTRAKNRGH